VACIAEVLFNRRLFDWTVAPAATFADTSASVPGIAKSPVDPPPDSVAVTVDTVAETPADSRIWNVTGCESVPFVVDSLRAFIEMTLSAARVGVGAVGAPVDDPLSPLQLTTHSKTVVSAAIRFIRILPKSPGLAGVDGRPNNQVLLLTAAAPDAGGTKRVNRRCDLWC